MLVDGTVDFFHLYLPDAGIYIYNFNKQEGRKEKDAIAPLIVVYLRTIAFSILINENS